jgi:phenylacetic acid degradation operon negative regulatory protein
LSGQAEYPGGLVSIADTDREPVLSRRHAAGAESARALLFTVLGVFVLPESRAVWTATFIDVLGRLGVEEKTSRQALMRTAADGWLTRQRQGRRTLWELSPPAVRLLTEGAARIYGFSGEQREWDGRWLLVLARTPESDRRARHLLRTRLAWAGLGSPAPGVWISTHPDRAPETEQILVEAGLRDDAQVFVAEHRGGGQLSAMVGQAWDLRQIDQRYQEFLAEFEHQPSAGQLARLVQLVHAWRRFPFVDPALPRELLPERWNGGRAARLFQRQRASWTAEATAEWIRIAGPSARN